MPSFLPATRLQRCPPPLVSYAAPVRTFLTTHGSHLNLVDTTVSASVLATLDQWSFGFLAPNQIRSSTASNDDQNNLWISATYARITSFSPGTPAIITTAAAHGLADGDIVEVFGAVLPAANGLHAVQLVNATQFTIAGVNWGGTLPVGSMGYVEKHADAVARRAAVVDGGPSNAAAAPFRLPAGSHGTFRGMAQANDHYFRYARDVLGLDAAQYVSGSAVTTPFEEMNRGRLGSYPMGPLLRTSKYANGWEIVASDDNGGNLRLTLNKTPPAGWGAGKPSVILLGHSNIHYVSDIAAELSGGGLDQAQVFTVASVAGNTLTLNTPYRLAAGSGGSLVIKHSGVSVGSDGGTPAKMRLTFAQDHALAVGDFVYLTDRLPPDAAVPSSYDNRTYVVRSIFNPTVVDLNEAYGSAATNRVVYGTCTPMRLDRCDLPDLSRNEVREIFLSDWSRHVERAFAQHGARHLWIDENAALYKLSAVDANPQFTPIDGTTERTLLRLGRQKEFARKYGRRVTANITWNATKDAMSPAQRRLLRESVDGLANEGACQMFLRSYYQMIGPDGFLENLEWLLARGFLYHYLPQPLGGPPTAITVHTNGGGGDVENGSSNSFGRTVLAPDSDGSMFPTFDQTAFGGHNLSGQLFGLYGHSDAGRNGVLRHRGCTDASPYRSETEMPWAGSVGQGGKIVHDHFARVMKTVSLTAGAAVTGGNRWRVRTEFPHLIWEYGGTNANNPSEVYLYGYSSTGAAIPDGTFFPVYPTTLSVGGVSGTSGNPVTVTVTAHGLVDGDQVDISGVVATGSLAVNGRYTIDATGANTFTLNGTNYTSGSYTSGGSVHVATCFELDPTNYKRASGGSDDIRDGIAFDVHADERYFAGLAMLLWRPGRLIVIDEGSLSYVRDWKNWIQGAKPDGPYAVTSFDGTATGGSTTTLTNAGAAFTDAVLGEPLLMTSGANSGKFSRIVARTATQLTVSPALAAAIASSNTYVVGKTATGDPTKVLELKRSFNAGAKKISVWPQKSATVASGF